VADPKKGSRHNRGAAVDATLVDAKGRELEMPTGFDDFSPKAHRGFAGASPSAAADRRALEAAMRRRGFTGLATEWWHFDAEGFGRYPVLDVPLDKP
jgi:D-alanyl-D-alanine dipeptidase